MEAFKAKCVDEAGETPAVVGHAERLRRIRGMAATRRIPSDHLVLIRERVQLRLPYPRVTEEAVQQNERLAPAGALIGDAQPFNFDLLHGHTFCPEHDNLTNWSPQSEYDGHH